MLGQGIKISKQKILKASELELGDVVAPVTHGGRTQAFDTAIVMEKRDGTIKLWRPYGTVAASRDVGGMIEIGHYVICNVTVEVFSIAEDGSDLSESGGRAATSYYLLHRNKKEKT